MLCSRNVLWTRSVLEVKERDAVKAKAIQSGQVVEVFNTPT